VVHDGRDLDHLAGAPPPCVSPCRQSGRTRGRDDDGDGADHGGDLGFAHVGDYLAYLALWAAIEDPDTAADLTSVFAIVGSVFAVLSRYAVNFWNQGLHQGASLSLDKEENVADVFYLPLLVSMAGFTLLFIALVLIGTRTEIRLRRTRALQARRS